jgi:hypothetical protein
MEKEWKLYMMIKSSPPFQEFNKLKYIPIKCKELWMIDDCLLLLFANDYEGKCPMHFVNKSQSESTLKLVYYHQV